VSDKWTERCNKHAFKFTMLVSVKNLNSSCCVSVTGASTRGTRQDMSHIFHREDKGTGFVY